MVDVVLHLFNRTNHFQLLFSYLENEFQIHLIV